ncbi:hypothetical protein QCA50_001717 [Cerrena zonata]|uniref:GYF domain-containing protein n=1 Tax=Cerrena zonata TaxID=2478898 RepID=A0AAW0GXQ9_9APHY
MSFPAGLSSDTLDANAPSMTPMQDDQWSDTHTVETDDDRDEIQEVPQPDEDVTIHPPKITTDGKSHDIHTPSPSVASPATAQELPLDEADVSSVHSVPVVQVTEPTSPVAPSTPQSTSSTFLSQTTSNLAPTTGSINSGNPRSPVHDRRLRHRSMQDNRASNRFSGFFSNLIHRRDPQPTTPTRETMASEPSPTPTPAPRSSSRASSPLPSRPSTPPPPLPAPTLQDLGLDLSTITSHISPAHFSSPPTSGAFLAPNYLLLCHAQGLDVLPLQAPPSTQPYTLIRRVPFKCVVVMEQRGVLVAIAGRRDGVRVYALEEVKRAIEWRMDVEIRRERERTRREEAKKASAANAEAHKRAMSEKDGKPKLFSSSHGSNDKLARRSSISVPSPNGAPRTPVKPQTQKSAPTTTTPAGPPPAYSTFAPPSLRTRELSSVNLPTNANRARTTSVNDVLAGTVRRRPTSEDTERDAIQDDAKPDWASSDDEAINLVAAPSGSRALDERTSAAASGSGASLAHATPTPSGATRTSTSTSVHGHRHRPGNLDLSMLRPNSGNVTVSPSGAPPSPTPTLLTLRQALMASPNASNPPIRRTLSSAAARDTPEPENDEDEDPDPAPSSPTTPTRERISLAEALFESRLPELPPVGTRQPQDAIMISSVASGDEEPPASPRTSDTHSTFTRRSTGDQSNRRRRRWSVFEGIFPNGSQASSASIPSVPEAHPEASEAHSDSETRRERTLSRSQSTRGLPSSSHTGSRVSSSGRPSTADGHTMASSAFVPPPPPPLPVLTPSGSRFIPRIITNAFHSRRNDDRPPTPGTADSDSRRNINTPMTQHIPAPKLEYVKLPGTKGSVMIKAVETAKKSFLAILCGECGEKVELFAGTYRTALGLSRTFILPDSPRSLELQLQGDDLVEVFLVFSQNVFGLEPATVRVREVRIGRAERRAARRRVRENRSTDPNDATDAPEGEPGLLSGEEDTAVNVSIGVTIVPASPGLTDEGGMGQSPLPSPSPNAMQSNCDTPTQNQEAANATDELITMATAQMSAYTTFQQLSFAPKFPLATIADDYVIPPTYPAFIDYRSQYEPDSNGTTTTDLSQVQFSPPGLPVPTPSPPSKWYYKDPKGVVHGPWKTSLMQAWYKDGLLPPELPVRREEDAEYVLLKELRSQCLDPSHPFRSSPPPPSQSVVQSLPLLTDTSKPLLKPLSLLAQPRHFGPPALFFSSRGGHSTTIVDARGRSVLKGRFLWSTESEEDKTLPRLGDVKRLEAFDVDDRAVLVAMRQGGLEVVDFGDALLKPADFSRSVLPQYHPPSSSTNRRGPFVWKIGSDVPAVSPSGLFGLPSKFPVTRGQLKKQSTGPAKSPAKTDFSLGRDDRDSDDHKDEVLFLGRKDDELYLCERRAGSFRILRLSPLSSSNYSERQASSLDDD